MSIVINVLLCIILLIFNLSASESLTALHRLLDCLITQKVFVIILFQIYCPSICRTSRIIYFYNLCFSGKTFSDLLRKLRNWNSITSNSDRTIVWMKQKKIFVNESIVLEYSKDILHKMIKILLVTTLVKICDFSFGLAKFSLPPTFLLFFECQNMVALLQIFHI